jgi:hypothetical protein
MTFAIISGLHTSELPSLNDSDLPSRDIFMSQQQSWQKTLSMHNLDVQSSSTRGLFYSTLK